MTDIREDYLELTALTQLHLLQEFSRGDRLMTDADSFAHFKRLAQQQPKSTPPAPVVHPPVQRQTSLQPAPLTRPKPPIPVASPAPTAAAEPSSVPQPKVSPPRIERSALPENAPQNLQDMQALMKELFPSQRIVEEIPSDQGVKRSATEVRPHVVILLGNEPPDQQLFLRHLARAIDLWLAPTIVATTPSDVAHVRLLVGSPSTLAPHEQKCPRYALDELASYLQDPPRKAVLWQTLQSLL